MLYRFMYLFVMRICQFERMKHPETKYLGISYCFSYLFRNFAPKIQY